MISFEYIKIVAIGAAIAGAAVFARTYTVAQYEAQIAEQSRQVAELQAENQKKTVVTVTKLIDRVKVVTQTAEAVVKEVPVYVTKESDSACAIPAGFVLVHDAAATGRGLPDTAGAPHATPSGVALSTVAETVANNYGTCHVNAEQLKSLQEWIRQTHGPQVPPN